MKKTVLMVICFIGLMTFSACQDSQTGTGQRQGEEVLETSGPTEETQDAGAQEAGEEEAGLEESADNILILYYSLPQTDGTDTLTSASRLVINGEITGSTQWIAGIIEEKTGGDLIRIETLETYPADYASVTETASQERADGFRPTLTIEIDGFETYDVVFIGYPTWWGDLPMVLYSLFDTYDFSGKTIIPFNTSGGSGLSRTVAAIEELESGAEVVEDAFTVSQGNVLNAREDVISWLERIGY